MSRLVLVAALLWFVAGSLAGFVTVHHEAHLAAAAAQVGRIPVSATVVSEGTPDPVIGEPCATVRYCTPDGKVHTGEVVAGSDVRPGDALPLWVTPGGAITSAPATTSPLRRSIDPWILIAAVAAAGYLLVAWSCRRWACRYDERVFEDLVGPLEPEAARWEGADS